MRMFQNKTGKHRVGNLLPTRFVLERKTAKRDKLWLLAVSPCDETGTTLKADTFALAKTKNLPPCGGFFCANPAFIPLGAQTGIMPVSFPRPITP